MICTECGNPVRAKGLCSAHYQRRWQRNRSRRVDKQQNVEQDRRDLLNAHRGAQKALRQLIQQYPEMDFTGAMKMCRERIAELSEAA